jgi:hypothetical protein
MDFQISILSMERARWFSEVYDALAEAERLLSELGDRANAVEKASLKLRLQLVRSELNSVKRVTPIEFKLGEDSAWPAIQPGGDYTPEGNSPPPANGSMNDPIAGAGHPAVAQKPRFRKAFLP